MPDIWLIECKDKAEPDDEFVTIWPKGANPWFFSKEQGDSFLTEFVKTLQPEVAEKLIYRSAPYTLAARRT